MGRSAHRAELEATLRGRLAQAKGLWEELERVRGARRWERHPFLVRWRAGEVELAELQAFATEHYVAVDALAWVARRAARLSHGLAAEQLGRYASEQELCVELWCRFAAATGWGHSAWYLGQDPLPETVACARTWSADGRPLVHLLVTIVVVESALSQISGRLLDALLDRYGFDERSARYFAHRAEWSVADAELAWAVLVSRLPMPTPESLVRHAEQSLDAYLAVLDGVHRQHVALHPR